MTFRQAIRAPKLVPADQKVLCLLDHLVSSLTGCFHTSLPGPTFELQTGRTVEYPSWEQWDEAVELGLIEVTNADEGVRASLTWAGQKRLNAWHKKGGRSG